MYDVFRYPCGLQDSESTEFRTQQNEIPDYDAKMLCVSVMYVKFDFIFNLLGSSNVCMINFDIRAGFSTHEIRNSVPVLWYKKANIFEIYISFAICSAQQTRV